MSAPHLVSSQTSGFSLLLLFGLLSFYSPLRTRAADPSSPMKSRLATNFELPPGFRIYKAAGPDLCGGSYDLTFDGDGRLLVGDGTGVRRLIDRDQDGVYDEFEMLARGLGPRGPQGMMVTGDHLYAVGADGIQLFEGYRSGRPLIHRGRLGPRLNTGGDHDAHTLLRGFDNYIYFMAGNGSGVEGTSHINSTNSPVLFAREASVFRIDPAGRAWECLATGGRNPPNLGFNFLADLFSLDSDMEWHVGLPWYRPVRLNHWVLGGDQGWQEVGAYPPYYLDCLPGILDVGRGSPTWGTFYEHYQFPDKYQNAFFVCDYRWKYATTDIYATSGRLLVFFLSPDQARWSASMEVLAKPSAGATNESGNPLHFALVDVEVGPDGSLFLSEHNQGIWRIFYDPETRFANRLPPIVPEKPRLATEVEGLTHQLLDLPQPGAEWSRQREGEIRRQLGRQLDLAKVALDRTRPLAKRLRALRLLAPEFATFPSSLWAPLAADPIMEVRSMAAWFAGLAGGPLGLAQALDLLSDPEPFVRRRAAESLARLGSPAATRALITHLSDPDRTVRSASMMALAHRPTMEWWERGIASTNSSTRMRALVASLVRHEPPASSKIRSLVFGELLSQPKTSPEEQLDFLRVLGLAHPACSEPPDVERIGRELLRGFPHTDPRIRWEQVRLLGQYQVDRAFGVLLDLLEQEQDHVAQFHIAQSIARLDRGWSREQEERLVHWFLRNQEGWFAEFAEKGVEFPDFWGTVLKQLGDHHAAALLQKANQIDLNSQLGTVAIQVWARQPDAVKRLLDLYQRAGQPAVRVKIVSALKSRKEPEVTAFFRAEYGRQADLKLRGAFLEALVPSAKEPKDVHLLLEGLAHPEGNVLKASAQKLAEMKPSLSDNQMQMVLKQLLLRTSSFEVLHELLIALTGHHPNPPPGPADQKSSRSTREESWLNWYRTKFGKSLDRADLGGVKEQSDEELHRFILTVNAREGDPTRGRTVYESAQCQSCHGGIPGREGRIFGPDLAGVTSRLTREQLADAMVYPSREVADRYRSVLVVTADDTLSGVITDETDETITLSDAAGVRRIPRTEIKSMTRHGTSLMPEHLLNRFRSSEIRDFMAFLEKVGGPGPKQD